MHVQKLFLFLYSSNTQLHRNLNPNPSPYHNIIDCTFPAVLAADCVEKFFSFIFLLAIPERHHYVQLIPQTKLWCTYKIFFCLDTRLILHHNPKPNPSPNHNLCGYTFLAVLAADCVYYISAECHHGVVLIQDFVYVNWIPGHEQLVCVFRVLSRSGWLW